MCRTKATCRKKLLPYLLWSDHSKLNRRRWWRTCRLGMVHEETCWCHRSCCNGWRRWWGRRPVRHGTVRRRGVIRCWNYRGRRAGSKMKLQTLKRNRRHYGSFFKKHHSHHRLAEFSRIYHWRHIISIHRWSGRRVLRMNCPRW